MRPLPQACVPWPRLGDAPSTCCSAAWDPTLTAPSSHAVRTSSWGWALHRGLGPLPMAHHSLCWCRSLPTITVSVPSPRTWPGFPPGSHPGLSQATLPVLPSLPYSTELISGLVSLPIMLQTRHYGERLWLWSGAEEQGDSWTCSQQTGPAPPSPARPSLRVSVLPRGPDSGDSRPTTPASLPSK